MAKYERPERTVVIEACTVDAVQCSERQVVNVNGADRVVLNSDWIVRYEDGTIAIFADVDFAATFEGPFADDPPGGEESSGAEGTGDGDPQA